MIAVRDNVRRFGLARLIALGVLVTGLVISASRFLPPAVDWRYVFRPGALALVSAQSPYDVVDYFSAPPWVPLLLAPLALLPENVGRGALFVLGLGAFGFVAYRLGAKPFTLLLFLISPTVMHSLLNGNLDWMAVLGFALPPWVGLFFILIKPQIGIGVALFWLVEAWRMGGPREVARVFWPITLTYAISFALFGLWPLNYTRVAAFSSSWNASLWPSSIPVGLVALIAALRLRKINYAMAASPCLSPYVLFHSWSAALIALSETPWEMLAAVMGLWALVILRALQVF